MSDREEWRPVPSVPGVFASSLGRVKMLPKRGSGRNWNRVYKVGPTFGLLRGDRYFFQPRRLGFKNFRVHRLVCEAFHGPAPPGKPNAIHVDEDATNNRPENLKWGTQKENLNAPGFIEYCRSRTGDDNPAVKGMKRRQRR